MRKLKTFFRELKMEVKKTTWPTKQQLISASSAVLFILITMGFYFGLLDLVFSNFTRWLIRILGIG
ncbi:MAG: preprotein translocase subunit SecE [Thermotogae bacterium]|nr:preprotein translocase subunit SecE [Thermotogota bacterium]RKX53008.1 MAG: preprotein translocase subunit SecE [Thermotoga sp.]